jgi:hypothetical protein
MVKSDLLKKSWAGYVLSIDSENRSFKAELTDILEDKEIIEVKFSFDELSQTDQGLLEINSLITWKIGTRYYSNDRRENFETISISKLDNQA